MHITIIGGGLTGLYIGYLLKSINIDFVIYDKSSSPGGRTNTINIFNKISNCGAEYFYSHHKHMIKLINKLKIRSNTQTTTTTFINLSNPSKPSNLPNSTNIDQFIIILNKISSILDLEQPSKNIQTLKYLKLILNPTEIQILQIYIPNPEFLLMPILDFDEYILDDLINKYQTILSPNSIQNNLIKPLGSIKIITDKLACIVQEKLFLNHNVEEITYMPHTQKYILTINGTFVHTDKVILATSASIRKIILNIPKPIQQTITNIQPIPIIKLFTHHVKSLDKLLKPNHHLQTQGFLTNIKAPTTHILSMNYINDLRTNKLYELLSANPINKTLINQTLDNLLFEQTKIKFPPIKDYVFCMWNNGFHINTVPIQTDFFDEYNLILAGEWVHPLHNTLEGSCMSAIKTFKIIKSKLFVDKLIHKPDGVISIESNRTKFKITNSNLI
jgi:hypothetical protein